MNTKKRADYSDVHAIFLKAAGPHVSDEGVIVQARPGTIRVREDDTITFTAAVPASLVESLCTTSWINSASKGIRL